METRRLIEYVSKHTDNPAQLIGMPLTGPWGLRRWVCERDVEAFARLYFPNEFTLELAPIHKRFVADIEEIRLRQVSKQPGLKLARAIPRGHSKSTYYSRIAALHGFVYGWSPLTVLLGNNYTAGERLTRNIKDEIETNERLREDFPNLIGSVWQSGHIQTTSGATIRSFGVGSGAIRGVSRPAQRPSLIIGDDLDDDQSVRSAVQLSSNIEWLTKAVLQLGDQVTFTTSFVFVGTIIRTSSLLSHILQSPEFSCLVEQGIIEFAVRSDLWDEWRNWYIDEAKAGRKPVDASADTFYQEHKSEMLRGTNVLWDRPDAYYLMQLYRLANGEAAFWSEIMNRPGEVGGALGKMPVKDIPDNLSGWMRIGALDPTTRGGKSNDLSAWVEGLFNPSTKELIISNVDAQLRPYGKTVEDTVEHIRSNHFGGLWCEANNSGLIIADAINEQLELLEIHQRVIPVTNSSPKHERIGTLSLYASLRQFYVSPEVSKEFEREWNGFPSYRYDDAIDAAATLVLQLRAHGYLNLLEEEDNE